MNIDTVMFRILSTRYVVGVDRKVKMMGLALGYDYSVRVAFIYLHERASREVPLLRARDSAGWFTVGLFTRGSNW